MPLIFFQNNPIEALEKIILHKDGKIFFVDLPPEADRNSIFSIHLANA